MGLGEGQGAQGGSSTVLFSCLPGAVFKSFSVCLCSRSTSLTRSAFHSLSLFLPYSNSLYHSLSLSLTLRPFCIVQRSTMASAIFANYVTSVNSNKFLAKCLRCCCFWPPPPPLSALRPPTNHKQIRCRANLLSSKLCTSPKLAANE